MKPECFSPLSLSLSLSLSPYLLSLLLLLLLLSLNSYLFSESLLTSIVISTLYISICMGTTALMHKALKCLIDDKRFYSSELIVLKNASDYLHSCFGIFLSSTRVNFFFCLAVAFVGLFEFFP